MPANRRAWYALADLTAAEKFDAAAIKPVEQLLKDQLDRRWPEFATLLRLRAVRGRGTIECDAGIYVDLAPSDDLGLDKSPQFVW